MTKNVANKGSPDIGAPDRNLEYASTILCMCPPPYICTLSSQHSNAFAVCISCLLVASVYVIYWKGPVMRKKSPFAQQLSDARKESTSRRASMTYSRSAPQSRRASDRVDSGVGQ